MIYLYNFNLINLRILFFFRSRLKVKYTYNANFDFHIFAKKILPFVFILFSITPNLKADPPKYFWATIPFVQGVNMCNLQDAINTPKADYIHTNVKNAIHIMMAGASGMEALDMLIEFDNMYERNRLNAQAGLDIALANKFKFYLDQIINTKSPRNPKIAFRHIMKTQAVVDSYAQAQSAIVQNPNKSPDTAVSSEVQTIKTYPHTESLPWYLDYIASGSFNYSRTNPVLNECQLDINLDITDIASGVTKTFQGAGSMDSAMKEIAIQFFNYLNTNPNGSVITDGRGNTIIQILGTLSGRRDEKVTWDIANQNCIDMEGRLPTSRELMRFSQVGAANGGIDLLKHGNYHLNEFHTIYVADNDDPAQRAQPERLLPNSFKEAYYFCVKTP